MADVIAGLVLGGIPIALWALEKYHDPVKSFWKYDMTLSTLRDNIFIQQQQLHITLRLIGLYQPTIDELRECLEEKYPNQHKEFLSIIKQMDEITKGLLDKLKIDLDGRVRYFEFTLLAPFINVTPCSACCCKYHSCLGPKSDFLYSHYGQVTRPNELNGSGAA